MIRKSLPPRLYSASHLALSRLESSPLPALRARAAADRAVRAAYAAGVAEVPEWLAQLGIYGVYELQTLEAVLRRSEPGSAAGRQRVST